MNARQILPLVEAAQQDDPVNLYDFATRVAEAQKEQDAKLAEAVGADEVAAMIRAAV